MTEVLAPGLSGNKQRTVNIAQVLTGRALLNFGMGSSEARVAVPVPGITATATVMARRLCVDSASHSADEHLVEDLEVDAGFIVPGVGFSVIGRPRGPRLFGIFNVAWSCTP